MNIRVCFGSNPSLTDKLMLEEKMIEQVIERWFEIVQGKEEMDDLLDEDCVFWSPILFHPQIGRKLTKMYLSAASVVFPGDKDKVKESSGSFRYTKRVMDGNHAVLEFETVIDGISVNGVDIITCNDEGKIIEFKVMLRPQKAVEKAREQMMDALTHLNLDS